MGAQLRIAPPVPSIARATRDHLARSLFVAKTVVITDDLDGTPTAETVVFSFDGVSYPIDLGKRNRAAFEKVLKPYLDAATKVSGGSRGWTRSSRGTSRRPQRSRPDLAAVRAWAAENGLEVSQRGRIA